MQKAPRTKSGETLRQEESDPRARLRSLQKSPFIKRTPAKRAAEPRVTPIWELLLLRR